MAGAVVCGAVGAAARAVGAAGRCASEMVMPRGAGAAAVHGLGPPAGPRAAPGGAEPRDVWAAVTPGPVCRAVAGGVWWVAGVPTERPAAGTLDFTAAGDVRAAASMGKGKLIDP